MPPANISCLGTSTSCPSTPFPMIPPLGMGKPHMNKTLRHCRRLAFHRHSWPVQFCNSIKIKSPNPLASQRCFHMPASCVRRLHPIFPPSGAYIVLLQFNERDSELHAAACRSAGLCCMDRAAHQPESPPPAGERREHCFVWKNILSVRPAQGGASRSASWGL